VALLIPRLDFPVSYNGANPAQIEQDSQEDILNCVEVVLSTREGERLEVPEFGLPDLTFNLQPLTLSLIETALSRFEPRATTVANQNPALYDEKVAQVIVGVSTREVT
jgi:phage baseplate assembly protein W